MELIVKQSRKLVTDAITAGNMPGVDANNVAFGFRKQALNPSETSVSIFLEDSRRLRSQTGEQVKIHDIDYVIYNRNFGIAIEAAEDLMAAITAWNDVEAHRLLTVRTDRSSSEQNIDGWVVVVNTEWNEIVGTLDLLYPQVYYVESMTYDTTGIAIANNTTTTFPNWSASVRFQLEQFDLTTAQPGILASNSEIVFDITDVSYTNNQGVFGSIPGAQSLFSVYGAAIIQVLTTSDPAFMGDSLNLGIAPNTDVVVSLRARPANSLYHTPEFTFTTTVNLPVVQS